MSTHLREPVSSARTAARLGAATLAYLIGVTLIITLSPFRFELPRHVALTSEWTPLDLVANLVMFLPLGFLFRLARRGREGGGWFHRFAALPLLLGALVSVCIEVTQMLEPERYSSLYDVATNASGAWVGALAYDAIAGRLRLDLKAVGALALELPLMGLVYLLIPLLWLDGLTGGDATHHWLTVLLGLFGATILSAVHHNYFAPTLGVGAHTLIVAVAGWFLVGALPGVATQANVVPVAAAGIAVFAASQAWTLSGGFPPERRFEGKALRRALPFFLVYLLLSAMQPLPDRLSAWTFGLVLEPAITTSLSRMDILRFLELVAAFTVLGYIVAELRGRLERSYASDVRHVVGWCAAVAAIVEVLRGLHPAHGASAPAFLLFLSAGIIGGLLYHLQREHVRALAAESRRAGAPSIPARRGTPVHVRIAEQPVSIRAGADVGGSSTWY
jgi:glycopeptide antibiotics resistance protein